MTPGLLSRAGEIDALIDAVQKGRLQLAIQDAIRTPSPANLAALESWPPHWVAEAQQVYGVPRDRRRSPRVIAEPKPHFSAWEWMCWHWLKFWYGRAA